VVSASLAVSDLGSGQILIVVALLALPIAGIAFAGVGSALKTLGKGRFAIDQDLGPSRKLASPPRADKRVREAEIRQMLEAKSYRREQRGEAPLDIEAEMERLIAPQPAPSSLGVDKELREEVRQLVIARNARRMRQGKPPLDVAEEVERQLVDLENLGQ
jgi:hypothetical protein